MNLIRITQQSLRFYWKTHLATGLAILVAAAVLAGALAVGDSIKATLTRRAQMRLGRIGTAVQCPGLFRAKLASELEEKLAVQRGQVVLTNAMQVVVAPVLQTTGFAENTDSTVRVGNIQILGIDERYWKLGPRSSAGPAEEVKEGVAVSRALAQRLGLKAGQEIVVRMRAVGGTPAETVLTPEEQTRVSFRRTVARVVEEEEFGGFDLYSRPDSGLNVFVPLEELNAMTDAEGGMIRANMLLIGGAVGANDIRQTLPTVWQLEDAGLELRLVDWPRVLELRSRDVFIPDAIAEGIQKNVGGALGLVTYFVNELRCGERTVPYSFVCAVDDMPQEKSPVTVTQDEMIINEWLADALKASEGDKIEIRYFVPSQGKKLVEQAGTFTVKTVIPMIGSGADSSLMPGYKALADAENCRDWNAGIPIDLSKIRSEDEKYWKKYKGAPKAFISMKAARLLWSSRFGTLTAIRFSVDEYDMRSLRAKILSAINPWQAGFVVLDMRHTVREAAKATTDFGGLVTGLSLFLIASSLILAGLVWSFGLRRRAVQVGMLSATGFTKGRIGWVFLLEEGPVVLIASLLGTAAGLIYTKLILAGLNDIWAGAAGGMKIIFAFRLQTLILAMWISIVASWLVWLLRIREFTKRPAAELLDRTQEILLPKGQIRFSLASAVLLVFAAAGLSVYGTRVSAQAAAGMFFGAGAMVLISMALFLSAGLAYLGVQTKRVSSSRWGLAIKSTARRRGRSLAVSMTLAMGVFVVLATGIFQQAAPKDPTDKASGTGGFMLWAQSSVPLVNDLNDARFQQQVGIAFSGKGDFDAVPLRMWSAEDASCLNIGRAQQPSLWGVRPEALAGRFRFKKVLDKKPPADPWEWLDLDLGEDTVPAIGDWATVYWGLHKDVGDEVDYTDQNGRVFRLKIVALLDDSILQGGLVISEKQFLKRFENASGWNVFLMDVPVSSVGAAGKTLTQLLGAYGFEVQTTAERLAMFHQVENTYIGIFMVLGSLGLVVGTVGLGLVVMLNAMERAGEMAMMRAIGYGRKTLSIMLFAEHAGLLTAGLVFGIISAAVAAGPQLEQMANLPWKMVASLTAVMWVSGLVWVGIAASMTMRGDLLEPLRKE
jgi:ABC-type lipoprotein release transport system permease subunit